ncbi:alpha/beta hydrolase-fold protein, partial [Faecalibaculum rodentium]
MILKFEVFMEKLQCSRMIHMYLPDDYLTSGRDYPVLYMFDGHNLFFDEDATFGRSWRLQEEIQAAGADLIVVGQECSHEGNAR